jgi:ubiquinone/menaquinone biosynthesis C-methylase UbiE
VFDQYVFPAECRILEVGCGSGILWQQNLERIPPGWRLTLTDFSEGMLEQARQNLGKAGAFTFQVVDAQSIPFEDEQFDVVIANFMLYHVPDRPRALGEIRRVLKPGGQLYATTVGERHMQELMELPCRFDPSGRTEQMKMANEFTLENGQAQLEAFFAAVEVRRYPDALEVSEVEPLVDYLLSTSTFSSMGEREAFTAFVQRIWEENGGVFHVTKDSGMFLARKPAAP